jgi:hypothetical protein
MTTKITSDNIATSTLNSLGGGVKITTVAYPGSATAADPAGSQTITVTGSGFNTGITAYINSTLCSTTYGNSTSLTFTTPATSAGTYNIILYNTDGTNGTKPAGIIFNQPPVWVTAAGALTPGTNNVSYSTTVSATGTGITYSVTSGALPDGLSLNSSSGEITGTPTVVNTFNFTITATNNYNQPTARAFSIAVINVVPSNYLILAGGGSGGTGYYGGGGGAGGYIESTVNFNLNVTYTVTVGTGGVGTTSQTTKGGNGGNSSISGSGFTTITAIGGGGGGSRNGDSTAGTGACNGADGGSGGGVGFSYPGTDVASSAGGGAGLQPASASGGNGNKGAGQKSPALGYRMDGGGGGGAGAAGNPTNLGSNPGMSNGAVGLQSSITGSAIYYGGGGAGGIGGQPGGTGGGGATNTAGTANTGAGGGGGSGNNTQGGNGGSGVVIIKYPDTFPAASTTGSPTVTSITGYRIYKFTGTGTFAINS